MREGVLGVATGVLLGIIMIVLLAVFVPAPTGEAEVTPPATTGNAPVEDDVETGSALEEVIEEEDPITDDEAGVDDEE